MKNKYQSVSLEKNLLKKVDDFVKQDPFITSRAEFVRRAIQNDIENRKK